MTSSPVDSVGMFQLLLLLNLKSQVNNSMLANLAMLLLCQEDLQTQTCAPINKYLVSQPNRESMTEALGDDLTKMGRELKELFIKSPQSGLENSRQFLRRTDLMIDRM